MKIEKFASATQAQEKAPPLDVAIRPKKKIEFLPLGIGMRHGGGGIVTQLMQDGIPKVIKTFKRDFRRSLGEALREVLACKTLNKYPNVIKCYDLLFLMDKTIEIPIWWKYWSTKPSSVRPEPTSQSMTRSEIALTFPKACGTLRDFWEKKRGIVQERKSLHPGSSCQLSMELTHERLIPIIMYQLLRAVNACHHADIMHRDIKPENILLFTDPSDPYLAGHLLIPLVQLTDFGITLLNYTWDPRSVYFNNVYTGVYQPPELLISLNKKHFFSHYSMSSEMWSIGIILFQLFFKNALPFGLQHTGEKDRQVITQENEKALLDYFPLNKSKQIREVKREYQTSIFRKLVQGGMPADHATLVTKFIFAFLRFEPMTRITTEEALNDPFFSIVYPNAVALVEKRFPSPRIAVSLCQGTLASVEAKKLVPWPSPYDMFRPYLYMKVMQSFQPNIHVFSWCVGIMDTFMSLPDIKEIIADATMPALFGLCCAAYSLAVRPLDKPFFPNQDKKDTHTTSWATIARIAGTTEESLARAMYMIMETTKCNFPMVTLSRFVFKFLFGDTLLQHRTFSLKEVVRIQSGLPNLDLLIFLTLLHPNLVYQIPLVPLATGIVYLWEQTQENCFGTCIASVDHKALEQKKMPPFTVPSGFATQLQKVLENYASSDSFPESYKGLARDLHYGLLLIPRETIRGKKCIPLIEDKSFVQKK